MAASQVIRLNYRLCYHWKATCLFALAGVCVFHLMSFPASWRLQRGTFYEAMQGHPQPIIKGLLTYYLPFEIISVYLINRLLLAFRTLLRLDTLEVTLPAFVRYQIVHLPFFILIIPLFSPITNLVRYLLVLYPQQGWEGYFPGYVFTVNIFLNYLLPVQVIGYVILNVNLWLDYLQQKQAAPVHQLSTDPTHPDPVPTYPAPAGTDSLTAPLLASPPGPSAAAQPLAVWDGRGHQLLSPEAVLYVMGDGKKCVIQTPERTYTLRKTVTELEQALKAYPFFRLNRSVLVNLRFVKNYSYWEHDKYIVRLEGTAAEFTMQRARMKAFKEQWVALKATPKQAVP